MLALISLIRDILSFTVSLAKYNIVSNNNNRVLPMGFPTYNE